MPNSSPASTTLTTTLSFLSATTIWCITFPQLAYYVIYSFSLLSSSWHWTVDLLLVNKNNHSTWLWSLHYHFDCMVISIVILASIFPILIVMVIGVMYLGHLFSSIWWIDIAWYFGICYHHFDWMGIGVRHFYQSFSPFWMNGFWC